MKLFCAHMSAMRCVALNQIDPSYVMCIRSFVVLCPQYSILSSPLPFHSTVTRFLEKGNFSDRLCGLVFTRKMFEV